MARSIPQCSSYEELARGGGRKATCWAAPRKLAIGCLGKPQNPIVRTGFRGRVKGEDVTHDARRHRAIHHHITPGWQAIGVPHPRGQPIQRTGQGAVMNASQGVVDVTTPGGHGRIVELNRQGRHRQVTTDKVQWLRRNMLTGHTRSAMPQKSWSGLCWRRHLRANTPRLFLQVTCGGL